MTARAPTVTIMFTDLVGSTALANRLGETASQALRRAHERILTGQFERYAGEVIKGTGDGFMVAFASARDAVECAVEIQRAIGREHSEGRYADLGVRIGVHTGEPIRENDDLFGRDVNLAARIEAEADGGAVLISQVTWLLTRDTPRFAFTPSGERSLKGFDDPVPVFDVRAQADTPDHSLTRFIGRTAESADLRQAIDDACRGRGRIIFVTGDAGVGKTRLVTELAIVAGDHGMDVLTGSAYDADGLPPFVPVVEALRRHIAPGAPDIALSTGDAGYVGKLIPGLLGPDATPASSMGLDPESERDLLFQGLSALFRALAQRRPVMLVIDDLHWADQSTLLWVRHVAEHIEATPLLIVATYREVEVDKRHALTSIVPDLIRRKLAHRIPLRPFDPQEAAALAEAVSGARPAPHVLDAVIEATEGNSFFIEELIRHLREQGYDLTDPGAAVADWGIPEGVRQLILRRLGRIEEDAQRLLSYSSVIGHEILLPAAVAITERDEMAVLERFDEFIDAGLLRETNAGYVFAHPLIRETLYAELSPLRRRLLHRRVGLALEAMYAADVADHAAELALHFYTGRDDRDRDKIIDYACRAAAAAEVVFAYEDAVLHYTRAVEVFDSLPGERAGCDRADLLLRLGDAQWKTGGASDMRETFRQAADCARTAGEGERFARAALGFGSGEDDFVAEDAQLVGLLREALTLLAPEPTPLRASLLARLAPALMTSADRDEARATSAAAVETAQQAGDPSTLLRALNARHEALLDPGELEQRVQVGNLAVELAEQAGDRVAAWYAHDWRLTDLLELGEREGAAGQVQHLFAIAEELRQPYWMGLSNVAAATTRMLAGEFTDAERLIEEAASIGRRQGAKSLEFYSDVQRLALRREQGRLGETGDIIERWVAGQPNLGRIARLEAPRHAELGDTEAARRCFERVAADDFADLPRDNVWIYSLCVLADVCAFLQDASRATALYRLLLPYENRYATFGDVVCAGSVARFVGSLACTAGLWADAESHLRLGLDLDERMGAAPAAAYGAYECARVLRARDGTGDRARYDEWIERAIDAAAALGMPALEHRAAELANSR